MGIIVNTVKDMSTIKHGLNINKIENGILAHGDLAGHS